MEAKRFRFDFIGKLRVSIFIIFSPDDLVAVMMYGERTSPAVNVLSEKLTFLNILAGY